MTRIRVSLLLAVCLAALGIVTTHAAEPAAPEGAEWKLVALNGKDLAAAAEGRGPATIRLDAAKKSASGFSGVNRFFGGYEREGDKLKFGALASTRMAGPPEAMAAESAYLAALGSVTAWRIADGALELLQDAKVVARFSAEPAKEK